MFSRFVLGLTILLSEKAAATLIECPGAKAFPKVISLTFDYSNSTFGRHIPDAWLFKGCRENVTT